ncbi:MAG: sigma-54-dependent Fis family transcriptional regulator, partial [Deltaproteobacteria bacterium]|nr:sigma-54-dependent Fis family transcriptional regulator [Deltaproteobacteria bacterium]
MGPEPHLFLVMDCAHPAAPPARVRLALLDEVLVGRGEVRELRHAIDGGVRRLRVEVADDFMSQDHARFGCAGGRWYVEDAGSKNGTLVNGVPVDKRALADGDLVELGHNLFLYRAAVAPRDDDRDDDHIEQLLDGAPGLRTVSPDVARVFDDIARAAPSPGGVLLRGEPGTGAEVVARTIHELSGRTGSYVGVDCSALPAELVEVELFGQRDRLGLVRHADGGTLFLDEVGDLGLAGQASVLRMLEAREVTPIGRSHGIAGAAVPIDVRIVAATHRDLPAMIAAGTFRPELYARLAGATLALPPLRERREDLGLFTGALLRAPAEPALQPKAGRCLVRHAWPGNLRELEHGLGRAAVHARGKTIAVEHLPEALRAAPESPVSEAPDRSTMEALMREHHGNISAIARRLGKAPVQIRRWLKRHDLVADAFRDD